MTKFTQLVTNIKYKARLKLISALLVAVLLLVLGGVGLSKYNDWSQENKLTIKSPLVVQGWNTYTRNWIEIEITSNAHSPFLALGQ